MHKMLIAVTAVVSIAGGAIYLFSPKAAQAQEVMLYKNPQCGCCEAYADYLRDNGFTVKVVPTHELVAMSREAGIPEDSQGCHLSMIDGYAISGHVPVGTVRKLITERPDVAGVTLPGMPLGSPGMGGDEGAQFEILTVSRNGAISGVYAPE